MRCKALLVSSFMLLSGIMSLSAAVPAHSQAELMVKIISMDRNFARYGDPITIGVTSQLILARINKSGGAFQVKGRTVVGELLIRPGDLSKYKVAYIGENWAKHYPLVSKQAIAGQIFLFCEEEGYVVSGGGAVSFTMADQKPRLMLNLKNARNQGAAFSADFLKTLQVVD